MRIEEITALEGRRGEEILLLMRELDPEIRVTSEMLRNVVESENTHLFALMDGERIIGCASLGVIDTPTGRKAHVEDVVVLSTYRGQHLGRRLMEYVIDYARRELGEVDLYLTSRPHRVAANRLYQSLGFRKKETNCYKMSSSDKGT